MNDFHDPAAETALAMVRWEVVVQLPGNPEWQVWRLFETESAAQAEAVYGYLTDKWGRLPAEQIGVREESGQRPAIAN